MHDRLEVADDERLEPAGRAAGPPPPPPPPPSLLVEVPHGATRRADFDALRSLLRGRLPDDLEAFFHVNTDEGAPELARSLGRALAKRGRAVRVLRCRIPRTLIDTNRVVTGAVETGMTAGLPDYLHDPADRALLLELHARYRSLAEAAYEACCGAGGLALALHTYAPRSVEVDVDAEIVPSLRRAYRPGRYRSWPRRPPLDAITAAPDGEALAPPGLVERLRESLARLDPALELAENASYRLHPSTSGALHARRWPGRVLCLEVRRDLLGSPWKPFDESRIGPRKAARLARALAEGIDGYLSAENGDSHLFPLPHSAERAPRRK